MSERIKNAPELVIGLQFYVDVFNTLSPSRQMYQGGIGAIPYSEISSFCKDEGITGDQRDSLVFVLGEMDRAYIEWQTNATKKAMEAQSKAAKAAAKQPSRGRR